MSECGHKTWSDYMKAHGKEEYDLEEAYYTRLEKELALLYKALLEHKESMDLAFGYFEKTNPIAFGALRGFYEGVPAITSDALGLCSIAAQLAKES